MARYSENSDTKTANKVAILDRAILQAVSLREIIFEIDDAELKLMIDVLLFGLGQTAAACVQTPNLETAMREAA